ncbi:hypothetical protein [Streptomyces sp. NPDC058247]|uniref:hypothetical protein n=1 Tax=Streptomyces sp. NPDC058247 TaxID=3346401 RepID=UPI0036EDCCCB
MAGFKIDKRAIAKMQKEIVKELERANRKHPVRIPLEVEPTSMGVLALASAGGLESDPQLSRLLLWLHESGQQDPGPHLDVKVFARSEGLPEDDSDNGLLEARRLLALRTDSPTQSNASGTPVTWCCAGFCAWVEGKPLFWRRRFWKIRCAASPGIP